MTLARRCLIGGRVALAPLLHPRSAQEEALLWALGDSRFTPTLSVFSRQIANSQQQKQQQHAAAAAADKASTLSFEDHEAIFKGQSTASLVRGLLVFTACSIPGFVGAAPTLLKLSRRVLGEKLTMQLIKSTFFAQFCGGEDDASLQGKVAELRQRGIGSILDFAAEDDESAAAPAASKPTTTPSPTSQQQQQHAGGRVAAVPAAAPAAAMSTAAGGAGGSGGAESAVRSGPLAVPPGPAVARQYSYESEAQCDGHVQTFLTSIASAGRMPGQGFAAVKLTALGNPLLLKRVSMAIREVRGMFEKWDTDGNQVIDRHEFETAYRVLLPDASPEERKRVFEWMGQQEGGKIDYVAWCQRLSLTKMPELAARIAASSQAPSSSGSGTGAAWRTSLQNAALTPEEVKLLQAMRARLRKLASAAAEQNVKLMMDAEHTYFQPAIDHLTLELARQYNVGPAGAIIYNTYQAYLKDTPMRLVVDLERARREGYVLGAKLVRGAYMEIERARAASKGYESPVWPSVEHTHESYDQCGLVLLKAVKEGRAEVLFGTHNQQSIERVVREMAELGLDPVTSQVYFGQLLGMADHLTQALGSKGYGAYKYVPYGEVKLVVPYLLRRATENASIMKGSKRDVALLRAELWRRARAAVGMAQ